MGRDQPRSYNHPTICTWKKALGSVPNPGLAAEGILIAWSADSRSLFVTKMGMTAPVYRIELPSGKRDLWKELAPADRAGITVVLHICILPDQSAYAYSYDRVLSQLFTVQGLK